MKKRRSIVWKMVGLLLLLPILFFLFLQTPPGKSFLARSLSAALSHSDQHQVVVGTITGWLPGKVTVSSLEVGDAQGTWLTAEKLHFRWMIRELLDERIRFRELRAERITWHRFPAYEKQEKPEKPRNSDFQPLEVRLDGLNVKTLRVEKGVAGTPLNYAVHSGGVKYLTTGRLSGELTVSGDADGAVELEAVLAGNDADYLKIFARLDDMQHPTFGLDQLSGDGEAMIQGGEVNAVLTADLAIKGQDGRLATRLHFAERMLRLQQFQLSTPDYSCMGDLSLGFTNGAIGVALESSFIDAATNRYLVRGTSTVATSNKTWGVEVDALEVAGWDSISFTLAGHLSPESLALTGALAEMDVAQLPMAGSSNFHGKVNGTISVGGSLEEPTVAAGLEIAGLSSSEDALDELPELDFRISVAVADGMLSASTSITNYINGHFVADLAMPCIFTLAPFRYAPVPGEISANVGGDLDLDLFNRLALFQDQRVSGMLKTQVTYQNRVPTGFLKLENGRYEHFDLGLVFRDFNADFSATPDGFVVNEASATDGGDGRLLLSGKLGAAGLDLQLDLSNAGIIRRDEMDAQISGQLQVKGRVGRPDVSGALTIDRAEILLDNLVPPAPPLLTNYDSQTTNAIVVVRERKRKAPPVGLDIQVALPDQVFVNASMIEAVLGGRLHITDAPRGVSVKGSIEPRRGFVNFIGKKFRFTEGEIMLDGAVPTVAVLDGLTAEYSRRDVTARLVLNGPADHPRFRLESSPPMPEDEVLSHVLFNRDTSSISPYQAYQIAAAARQLSGGLNGPGFMFQVRQAIGIDTLEWREAEAAGEGSSVAAGKYITSGLYVEINQSLDERGETGMVAELEVTRHFSVETYTGPKMRPGIGVNWRNDY
ncbi:translocation/assembly module TamB domain-containing protein [Pontiellaceae bacterium B12227]|nr:translocation/assembly module TamB domain-containing protein [Pontiellaceae bacterium B12227]